MITKLFSNIPRPGFFTQQISLFLIPVTLLAILSTTPSPLKALPTGNDFQRLNPNTSGIDFVSLESSHPTPKGSWVLGSVIDYSLDLQPATVQPGIKLKTSDDSIVTAHQFFSLGILPNLEINGRLPIIVFSESLSHLSDKGEIQGPGLTYIALGAKYRFLKKGPYEMALGGELGTDLMEDNPYIGAITPFISSVFLTITTDLEPVLFGVNLGYRFRTTGPSIINPNTGSAPIAPRPHTLIGGAGLTYQHKNLGNLSAEAYGTHDLALPQEDQTDRHDTAVEILATYHNLLQSGIGIKIGAGTEILQGPGSAHLRFFAGVDYLLNLSDYPIFKEPKKKTDSPSTQEEIEEQLPDFDDVSPEDFDFGDNDPVDTPEDLYGEEDEEEKIEAESLPSF